MRSLVGREAEVAELVELLDEYRLITLIGPAGVGKTSLARELSDIVGGRFAGGTFVVELSGAQADDDVVGLIARQLDAATIEGFRLRTMGSETLLVLDNCESASAASREVAAELLDGKSAVTVLATSRSPLYLRGERLVPIRPLALPDDPGGFTAAAHEPETAVDDASPAERLFLDRATEAGAAWERTPQQLAAVRRLVRQLDGLPLAIELAAARSRVLGPVELADLLDQQLDLLVRPGGAGGRHQSLRSAIESSYEPLPSELQTALRRLAFMSAPFDLELAHAVIGTAGPEVSSLDLVSQLVDASLVDSRESAGGSTEYVLLDSIRAFGRERLVAAGEDHDAGDRYVDAVAERADRTVAAVLASFSAEVLASIADIVSHLVNAITWCIEHDPSPARTYRMALLFFGPTGSTPEIAELARRIRGAWTESAPLQAEAFAVMGSLTYRTGRYAEGAELAAIAVDHPEATAMAKFMGYRTLGYEAAIRRDNAAAAAFIDEAVPLGAAFSDAFAREIRVTRSIMEWDPAGSPAAIEALDEVVDEATRAEEWINVAWARTVLAFQYGLLDDRSAAAAEIAPAIDAAERAEMEWASITAHRTAGVHLARKDGWQAARAHFRTALDTASGIGDIDSASVVLVEAAGAAAYVGEAGVAAELWRTIPTNPGISMPPSLFADELERLREAYGRPSGIQIDELVQRARRVLDGADVTAAAPTAPTATGPARGAVLRFGGGEFELDFDMCELRRNGQRVPMEPQVYDVLAYLVSRRGHVVTKFELLDEVWGDRFVSENALSSRISAVRKATGDDGRSQRIIRTVHRKGFSFVAELDDAGVGER